MKGDIDLSIVIPTYDDKDIFPDTFEAYRKFFSAKGINHEIILADYSSDGSRLIISGYEQKYDNVKLCQVDSPGKGLAVYKAFKMARGKAIGFTDADNATSPGEFWKLYSLTGKYDAVIGSRGLGRTDVVHYHRSLLRKLGSLCLDVFFVKLLYGLRVTDTQCGAKIFKREKIIRLIPSMRIMNSIFDVELLWRFSKIGTIKEVPIKWIDGKKTHFRWNEIVMEFIWLIRARIGF